MEEIFICRSKNTRDRTPDNVGSEAGETATPALYTPRVLPTIRVSEMTFRGLGIWDLEIMTRVGVRKLGEIDGLREQSRMG